ncbi:unnamed protein product [Cyclocybe aegerita]|uniref:Uncharacterized protein n=1 Tax=Cyclocybe aegerita TaxID=1973307 RepID=A0A8S0X1H0_CYCAE|nr:unnamed protein product [Cyclocybe aegerita]
MWKDIPPRSVFLLVLCSFIKEEETANGNKKQTQESARPTREQIAASIRDKAGRPSEDAKNDAMHRTQKPSCMEAIYNGRPYTLTGPSISIFHPVFQTFLTRLAQPFKNTDYSRDDFRVADALLHKAAQYYPSKADRRFALGHLFTHFLGSGVLGGAVLDRGGHTLESDGSLPVICGLYDVVELGRWVMCKALTAMSNGLELLRQVSCMPAFLIAISGPSISISGAIYLDGVVSGRLLTSFPMVPPTASRKVQAGYPSFRDQHVGQLVHTLRVLRQCLDELDVYYNQLKQPLDSPLLPAPHFHTFTPPSSGPVQLRYLERIHPHSALDPRALFLAEASGGSLKQQPTTCIVKFTTQYGKAAHELMLSQDVAAPLLHCAWEPSVGMWVVVAEFLDEPEGAAPSAEGLDRLRKALAMLHEKGLVFGDLRAPNVMLDKEGHPRLIDFDWSGVDGEAQYPGSLNVDAGFPKGVKHCDFITAEHDRIMLKKYEKSFRQAE